MENDEIDGGDIINKVDRFKPYIITIGMITIIMLVVYLGFAFGCLKVCNQVDGFLDSSLKCHLDYKPPTNEFIVKADYPNVYIYNVSRSPNK